MNYRLPPHSMDGPKRYHSIFRQRRTAFPHSDKAPAANPLCSNTPGKNHRSCFNGNRGSPEAVLVLVCCDITSSQLPYWQMGESSGYLHGLCANVWVAGGLLVYLRSCDHLPPSLEEVMTPLPAFDRFSVLGVWRRATRPLQEGAGVYICTG